MSSNPNPSASTLTSSAVQATRARIVAIFNQRPGGKSKLPNGVDLSMPAGDSLQGLLDTLDLARDFVVGHENGDQINWRLADRVVKKLDGYASHFKAINSEPPDAFDFDGTDASDVWSPLELTAGGLERIAKANRQRFHASQGAAVKRLSADSRLNADMGAL